MIKKRQFYVMKRNSDKSVVCNDLDVREVKNLFSRHTYLKLFLKNFNKSKKEYIVYFLNSLFRFQTYSYIVYDKNKPIGIFTVAIEEDDDLPHLYDFSIIEEYRGSGFASKMIDWVCEEFEEWDSVLLNVECGNMRALNLYKKKGFEIVDFLVTDSL